MRPSIDIAVYHTISMRTPPYSRVRKLERLSAVGRLHMHALRASGRLDVYDPWYRYWFRVPGQGGADGLGSP